MNLHTLLQSCAATGNPVRVGLIGAGKFGSMFLSQVPTTAGMNVTVIADLDVPRAQAACETVGWDAARISATRFTEDAASLIADGNVDVVIEATGHPAAGLAHAGMALAEGKHIIMVNVEADVLAGPLMARRFRKAGLVYSMAYGDQPALTSELVDWARAAGFEVVSAGKGTKYLPAYHDVTPDGVWQHYGLTADEAAAAGMNSQMFNSFLDGTKSAIEMAAIANACGLAAPKDGLVFPPCSTDDLQNILIPREHGGMLDGSGMVEVVSSLNRDGTEVPRDLRWGVYVVIKAPTDYAAACFAQYGLPTDKTGQYAVMYKPFHLIGLELGISVLSAALRGEATGQSRDFNGDAVACAKRDLVVGDMLDGEGGYTVWGKLMPAIDSVKHGALPIGLAGGVRVVRPVVKGAVLCWDDVAIDAADPTVQLRREMEAAFIG
ncbi:MAG: Gfo/Idh/MocA family oxidoreductase [Proteobacteria bacterium]|nr:Gfo/Idh/MocA family oxidoreductase [Pseudomonadota bacterium]